MTVLTDTWQALVKRKLWPIALLLVAAVAAIPFVLKSDPAPVPPVPTGPTASDADVAAAVKAVEPVVAAATGSSRRRKVLGAAKNPFEPAPLPKVKTQKKKATTARSDSTGTGTPGSGSGTGGAPAGGGDVSTPAVPVVTEPKPKPKSKPRRHAADSLTVRFGDSSADSLERMDLETGEALPDEDAPVLIYLGLEQRGKVAVFLVDSAVTAQGDGACDPDPENCETLRLRVGDTEFLDILDEDGSEGASYELDLLRTWPKQSAAAKGAAAKASKDAKAAASSVALGSAASVGPAALGLAGIARLLGHL